MTIEPLIERSSQSHLVVFSAASHLCGKSWLASHIRLVVEVRVKELRFGLNATGPKIFFFQTVHVHSFVEMFYLLISIKNPDMSHFKKI